MTCREGPRRVRLRLLVVRSLLKDDLSHEALVKQVDDSLTDREAYSVTLQDKHDPAKDWN